jgi:S-formylglutathione hydrolase
MKPRHTVSLATLLLSAALLLPGAVAAQGASLVAGTVESKIVPGPVEYYALLPPGFDKSAQLPLVLNLHGGGGSRDGLKRQQPMFEELWQSNEIRPMVIVMPSVTARSFYMDFRDGSEKWETFLITEFLPHLRQTFGTSEERNETFITGISMGGMGSARLAFKYPEIFGAVAAMEPGIAPVLEWREMQPKHRFWRADRLFQQIYGDPNNGNQVDGDYWTKNNPAQLARLNRQKILESGLRIFLEAGDQDMFWLYEGTEFLHQILWQEKIRHEYRLYYGADHVGRSLGPRTREAFRFLSNTLDETEPDPQIDGARKRIDPLKSGLSEADHYGVDQDKIQAPPGSNN